MATALLGSWGLRPQGTKSIQTPTMSRSPGTKAIQTPTMSRSPRQTVSPDGGADREEEYAALAIPTGETLGVKDAEYRHEARDAICEMKSKTVPNKPGAEEKERAGMLTLGTPGGRGRGTGGSLGVHSSGTSTVSVRDSQQVVIMKES